MVCILFVWFFFFTLLITGPSLNISCHLLLLDVISSFCSRVYMCIAKIIVWNISTLYVGLYCYELTSVDCLHCNYMFGYIVYLFSFNSRRIHFFLFSSRVCNFYDFVWFLLLFSFNPWWSNGVQGGISVFFYLLRLALCPSMGSALERVPWCPEKVYCSCFNEMVYKHLLSRFGF